MTAQNSEEKYDLAQRLLEYSTRAIRVVESLPKTRAGNHVASQLLRSGTAPLANHGEAQAAESPQRLRAQDAPLPQGVARVLPLAYAVQASAAHYAQDEARCGPGRDGLAGRHFRHEHKDR